MLTRRRGADGYDGHIDRVPVSLPVLPCEGDGDRDRVSTTWLGHATCIVDIGGKRVLTDPVFSRRCSPSQWVGTKRYTAPGATVDELMTGMGVVIDLCIISHDHFDHLDEGSIRDLAASNGVMNWYVPMGTKSVLIDYGCPADRVREMEWWEEARDPSGLVVACLPAQHWCCRRPWDKNKRLWATWAVLSGEGKGSGRTRASFFFGGDTAYPQNFPLFKQIGSKYGPFTMAAIPIGAYAPRWFMSAQHCDPAGSLSIHSDVRSSLSVGIHWGTFPLADELFYEPVKELVEEAERGGVGNFFALRIGETLGTGGKVDMRRVFERLFTAADKKGG